jgi:hypothetical protein
LKNPYSQVLMNVGSDATDMIFCVFGIAEFSEI